VSRASRRAACALFVGLTLALVGVAATASASTPTPISASGGSSDCASEIVNDWYAGSIPTTFAVVCYQRAIASLPTANKLYTSERDDINRAMQIAIVSSSGNGTTTTKITAINSNGRKILLATQSSGGSTKDSSGTTSSGVSSFPLPLLILGGLAILLVLAGGIGLLIRRFQGPPPPDAA
jgi:hypothetical protein